MHFEENNLTQSSSEKGKVNQSPQQPSSSISSNQKDEEALDYGKKTNFRVEMDDMVEGMVFLGGLLASRACRECFVVEEDGKGRTVTVAAPLPSLYKPGGSVFRTYPTPSNSRVNDVISFLIRKGHCLHRHGQLEPPTHCYTGNDVINCVRERTRLPGGVLDDIFVKEVFQCVIAAITGRPGASGNYLLNYFEPASGQPVPSPQEIEVYIEYVQKPLKMGSGWCDHVHIQFYEAIPHRVRGSFERFTVFSK